MRCSTEQSRAQETTGLNLLLLLGVLSRLAAGDRCCFQDGQVTAQLLLLTVAQQSRAETRTHLLLDVDYYLPSTPAPPAAFPSLSSWAAAVSSWTLLQLPHASHARFNFWHISDTFIKIFRCIWLEIGFPIFAYCVVLGRPIQPTSGTDQNWPKRETFPELKKLNYIALSVSLPFLLCWMHWLVKPQKLDFKPQHNNDIWSNIQDHTAHNSVCLD